MAVQLLKIKYALFLGLLLYTPFTYSQIRLADLLKKANDRNEDLVVNDQTLLFDSEDPSDLTLLNRLLVDDEGRKVIPFNVRFNNCTFPDNLLLENFNFEGTLMLYECTFEQAFGMWTSKVDSLVSWNSKYAEFYLEGLTCNRFIMEGGLIKDWMELFDITVHKELDIEAKATSFDLIRGSFSTPNPTVTLTHDSLFHAITPTQIVDVTLVADEVSIGENTFESESDFDLLMFDLQNVNHVTIYGNTFGGMFSLKGSSNFIKIFKNKLNKVEYNDFSFPEFESSITWTDISGDKISGMFNTGNHDYWVPDADSAAYFEQMNLGAWEEDSWVPTFYFGQTDRELRYKWFYDELFSDYYRMYLLFKTKGKIEDANAIYIEMKELYGRRLGVIYKDDPTLKNFLNWQLNRLLKVYTDHGTDPAKAIVISIYIIMVFSFFYFLFPSEWDEFELRKERWKQHRLIKNLKTISIHFFNSLILSLNSFVTLGFGRIPTTGLARYICIVEGFIGWFLLSIFTVSLINQILF